MKKRIFNIVLSFLLVISMILPMMPVSAADAMEPSIDCIEILKQFEGFIKYPVQDYSQYTVGYGTRCPDADLARYRKQGITEEEAEELLWSYLETMCERLNQFIASNKLSLKQNQFDALVLFTYNVGTGWFHGTSDIKTAITNGVSDNDLIYYLSRWCTANYQVLPGLVDRRLAEADLFVNGNYSSKSPSYYSYVSFDPNGGACTSRVQGYDASNPPAVKAVPTRTNFRFLGWYTALEGGQWITDLDITTAKKTLYARWQAGDGNVSNGVIQGTPCNYKRKVSETEKLSVYATPNAAKPLTQLNAGITVKIVADYVDSAGAKWGKMEGGGWINLGTTQQIVTSAAKKISANVTVMVTGHNVNVRSNAGTGYTVVNEVTVGDQLVIAETKMVGNVKWGRYSGGWLSLEYTDYETAKDPAQTGGSTVKVTGTVVDCSILRVRTGPGTTYPVVGTLAKGERVEIYEIKTAGEFQWGKIPSGWICLSYVLLDEQEEKEEELSPFPEQPSGEDKVEEAGDVQHGVVVNCTALNVRSGAGMGNKLVDSLRSGTRVDIYETKNAEGMVWGRIKQGWICMKYVQLDHAGSEEGQTGTVISSTTLNIRATASLKGAWVGSLPSGSQVIIYETKEAGGLTWGRINRGWICMQYVRMDNASGGENNSANNTTGNNTTGNNTTGSNTETSAQTVSGTVAVSGALRIRSGAGTSHAQVGLLSNGTVVQIYETALVDGVKWGRIDKGWICMSYVNLAGEPMGTLGTVRADSLRIRSGPGTNHSVVGSYNQGTQIEILETVMVNGTAWGRTKQGWVSMNYVK